MKKAVFIMVAIFTIAFGTSSASAQMVDIGTGQIPTEEFSVLESMDSGRANATEALIAAPQPTTENYGMVRMDPAEYEALRDMVAGRPDFEARLGARKPVEMVNIGTGRMNKHEFTALRRMVTGRDRTPLKEMASSAR